jgi:hypothetical protein
VARLLRVELSSSAVDLEPGAPVSLTVRIVNTSQIVERYAVTVVGPAERWSTVVPAELPLMPDTEGTVEVTMTAPAEHAPPAGTAVVGIKVSSTRTGASWVEELEVRVSPVARATLALAPELRRTSGTADFEAVIDNQGNLPLSLELRGEDQERVARFQFVPPALEVWPEEPARVRVRVTVPSRWTGPDVTRMLTVHAYGAPEPLQASATLVQRSRLASGLLRAVGGVAAVAVIAGALLVPRLLGGDDDPADGPETTVGPVTTPTGPATSEADQTTVTEPATSDGGPDTTATPTTAPLGEPVVVRFDTRPDGGALTADLPLSGNAYAGKGIQLRGVPAPGHCPTATQTAIRVPGTNGIGEAFLTSADPNDVNLCNDSPIEIAFSQPVRNVTLTFTGANASYTMTLFDPSGQQITSVNRDAVQGGATVEVSSTRGVADVARVTFGRPASPTAVTEISYRR